MDALDRMLANVDSVSEQICTPQQFFTDNLPRYLAIAKQTARQTLLLMEPEDADPEEWARHTNHFLAAIFAETMALGFSIRYAGRHAAHRAKGVDEESAASIEDITWHDVLDWVEAGLAGDPDGKDIREYDTDAERTAYRVHSIISEDYTGMADYSAIRQRLNDWVSEATSQTIQDFLAPVLKAWQTTLAPIIRDDYSRHIDQQLRRL